MTRMVGMTVHDDLQEDILLHMLRSGVPLPVVLDQKDHHADRDDGQQDDAADDDEEEGAFHLSCRIGRSQKHDLTSP